MRALIFLAGAVALAAPTQLSETERSKAVQHLEKTRDSLRKAVAGLSDAQWAWKPSPEKWSVGEIVDHLATTEAFVLENIVRKTITGQPAPEKRVETEGRDDLVMKAIADRSSKFTAPEPLRPTGRWPTRDAGTAAFEKERRNTIDFVRTSRDDLRSYFVPHPLTKLMDMYQWVLTISAHTERHLEQLVEVKSDPGFPKQ